MKQMVPQALVQLVAAHQLQPQVLKQKCVCTIKFTRKSVFTIHFLQVNKTIQMLAQQYCNECKTSFEELSKIIQRVLVSRKELVAYDRKHRDMEPPKATPILRVRVLANFYFLNNMC